MQSKLIQFIEIILIQQYNLKIKYLWYPVESIAIFKMKLVSEICFRMKLRSTKHPCTVHSTEINTQVHMFQGQKCMMHLSTLG